MTIRHHQPLQVIPGEADPALTELPDAGFPDALVVYTYDFDYDALEWVKHSSSASGAGGGLTNTELRAAPVIITPEEGVKFTIKGFSYETAPIVATELLPVESANATAADPVYAEGYLYPLSVDLNGRLRAVTTGPDLIASLESDANHNPQYLGLAAKGSLTSAGAWQIRKFTIDGNNNVSAIRYANASAAFNAVWDDRASLSYS